MTSLDFKEFELGYFATLGKPIVDLAFRWADLYLSCLSHFERFELRPSEIRLESQTNHVSDFLLVCYLLGYTVVVKYRLGSIEVWTKSSDVTANPELAIGVLEAAVAALRAASPQTAIARQSITAMGHFDAPGESMSDRLARYISNVPSGSPPVVPEGIVLAADIGGGGRAVTRVELSARYPSPTSGFIRLDCEYPGDTPPRDAANGTDAFLQSIVQRLGLEPAGSA
jgi:hypothetical protein